MLITAAATAVTITVTKAGWLALAGAAYKIYDACKDED